MGIKSKFTAGLAIYKIIYNRSILNYQHALRGFTNSKRVVVLIALSWLIIMGVSQPWKKNVIIDDVVSYYAYLPATFIYHDVKLEKSEYKTKEGNYLFWPTYTAEGSKVIKTTMGLSVMYAPFFFVAHFLAPVFGQSQTGYSLPYQLGLLFSCLIYLLLGLHYLRKLLLLYFSETIVCLTIISVFFGTNLLWYSTHDGLMSHGYLFSLCTIFIYNSVMWHQAPSLKRAVVIGFIAGLMILIRPTMVLCLLVFLLLNIYSGESFRIKIQLFYKYRLHLLIIILACFLVTLPQLCYWKYTTGNWLFFSYEGERFYFSNPHIVEGLFSFRKGWFVYTPIMILAVSGVIYLRKMVPAFFLPVIIVLPLSIYILLSWWAWWYGGGFGLRAFIDFYGLFAIPMACFYKQMLEKNRMITSIVLILCGMIIYLNLFQTWQYKRQLIHFDSMTKKSYILGFRSTYTTDEWFGALSPPDYERARKGLSEIYSRQEISQITSSNKITLKGSNFRMAGLLNVSEPFVTSSHFFNSVNDVFSLIWSPDRKHVFIKAANNKFVSPDPVSGILNANKDLPSPSETFELIYLGNNKIAFRSHNGKYVEMGPAPMFYLYETGNTINRNVEFTISIK